MSITAGTTYIASYETTVGEYSADTNYFANSLTNGPLTAPSSSSSGGNGVYAYGSSNPFPNNTFNASNYWVDVVFSPGATQTPPVLGNVAASGLVHCGCDRDDIVVGHDGQRPRKRQPGLGNGVDHQRLA